MLCQVQPEVVPSGGASLFGDFVIASLIDFVVIKGDAIQGFKEPTVLAAELVCKRPEFQGILATMAAY